VKRFSIAEQRYETVLKRVDAMRERRLAK
jgi:hypothetical protein